jgi:hypothetical protein
MPRDAAPSLEGARNVLDQLAAIGTDVPSRDLRDYLDLSVIDSLKQAGYFALVQQTYPIR